MANQEQFSLLKQGKNAWNQWRQEHPEAVIDLKKIVLGDDIDLSNANLQGADLSRATLRAKLFEADLSNATLNEAQLAGGDLSNANLQGADLSRATLVGGHLMLANLSGAHLTAAHFGGAHLVAANLGGAHLSEADFNYADFRAANLSNTDLSNAKLIGANLNMADLSGANLSGADLSTAILVRTNLTEANLTGCRIYGISAWDVQLEGARQLDLVISPLDQPVITIDNIEVAQFINLLLNNQKIREVIDTITSKVVLILGRFTPERKAALDALRDELRQQNYTPVLFDFEKPASRDLTETVSTLAHLARFIIVDLTDPGSAPHEVATVIPHTVVPVQPLLLQEPLMVDGKVVERREYALFEDLRRRYHWVLPTFHYRDTADLLAAIQLQIIASAEQKVKELIGSEKRIVSSETHTMGL